MIRQRAWSLTLAAGLCVAASVWACWRAAVMPAPRAEPLLPALVPAAVLLLALALRAHKSLKAAELIVENRILLIRPVMTDARGCGSTVAPAEGMHVFVSCFGILAGSTIIAFNQGGAQLKAVEIGCDSISFTYGLGQRTQRMKILRPAIASAELADIVERFRYETGVVPTIITD